VWNHAKIVAVDGREMIIGGQNFWENDYLKENPVHDLSVRIKGSSTVVGHRFADKIWEKPCKYTLPDWKPALWRAGMNAITTGCLPNPALKMPPPAGNTRVLTVGRLGVDRVITAEASETAMWYAFEKTSGPIYIAQQDFLGTPVWDWRKPIIGAVVKQNRPVYLVVGDDNAKAGPPPGSTYKMPLMTMNSLLNHLWAGAKDQRGTMTVPQLQDRLCSQLSIAPFRFGPSKRWPNGDMAIGTHSKFWMIGSLYYIGSHNLYPAGLGELGVIVDDAASAADVKSLYWDKVWQYSKADARSGPDTSQCAFRGMS
jgi:phosphatidylserine/phosphatidylglycerophosphate/cardiolipin synthase-like enzyme